MFFFIKYTILVYCTNFVNNVIIIFSFLVYSFEGYRKEKGLKHYQTEGNEL